MRGVAALLMLVACGNVKAKQQPDAGVVQHDAPAVAPSITSVAVPPSVGIEGDTGSVAAALTGTPTTPLTVVFSGTLGTYAPTSQIVTLDSSGHGTATTTFTAGSTDGTEAGMVVITSPMMGTPTSFGFPVTPFVRLGNSTPEPSPGMFSPNFLLGSPIVVPTAGKLRKIGFLSPTAGPNIKVGIYSDVGGNPGQLVAQIPTTAVAANTNEITLAQPVALAAGTYWYMGNYDAQGAVFYNTNAGTSAIVKYMSLTFASALPTTFPGAPTLQMYTGQAFSYYLVMTN